MTAHMVVALGCPFRPGDPYQPDVIQVLRMYLEKQSLGRLPVGVLGFRGEGSVLVERLQAAMPGATIRLIDVPGPAQLERRFNGPEQTQVDHPFSCVILVVPAGLHRLAARYAKNHIRAEARVLLPFCSVPVSTAVEMRLDDEAFARPRVVLLFPCAGSARFSSPFLALMRSFDLLLDETFREPYSDLRFIRRHAQPRPGGTGLSFATHLVDQEAVDAFYAAEMGRSPRLYRFGYIHHPVTTAALAAHTDTQVISLVRDPRDVVNSIYHRLVNDSIVEETTELRQLTKEEALLRILGGFDYVRGDYFLKWPSIDKMCRDFLEASRHPHMYTVRFEEIRYDPIPSYKKLVSWMGLAARPFGDLTDEHYRQIVDLGSFASQTGGQRREGEEHGASFRTPDGRVTAVRKGEAGDWKNHFTRPVRERVEEMAGELITALGYERDRLT